VLLTFLYIILNILILFLYTYFRFLFSLCYFILKSDSQFKSFDPPTLVLISFAMSFFYVMKSKGVVSDMTGAVLNSNEDSERPDRAAARPWLDPRINMLVCEVAFLFLFILFTLMRINMLVCEGAVLNSNEGCCHLLI